MAVIVWCFKEPYANLGKTICFIRPNWIYRKFLVPKHTCLFSNQLRSGELPFLTDGTFLCETTFMTRVEALSRPPSTCDCDMFSWFQQQNVVFANIPASCPF